MFPLIKIIVLCLIATLFVSMFGEKFVANLNNEVGKNQENRNKKTSNTSNIVNAIQVPRQQDGHYWTTMNVSGAQINFMVDTGASYVTLSHDDAKKLNIYLHNSDYNIDVRTAGGMTKMAEFNIDIITLGVIELYDVKALIAQEGMLNVSLLGMSYLNRLESFEFREQELILQQ